MTDSSSSSLSTLLADSDRRPRAVAALAAAVEAEVQGRSGVSALPIKAGYKALTSLKPGMITNAINKMLPEFAEKLDPFWASREGQPFGTHLAGQRGPAAEALLSVTDARASKPAHARAAKIYNGLRPKAKDLVENAMPRVGEAIESAVR